MYTIPERINNFEMAKIVLGAILQNTRQAIRMAQLPALFFAAQFAFLGWYLYYLQINLDNFKGWLLTIAALFGLIVRIYYYIKEKEQKLRNGEYDLLERERQKKISDQQENPLK